MKFNKQLLVRKTHRYLGVFIGIQFLAWTIGGIYFSWNNLDSVRGDFLRKTPAFISSNVSVVSPSEAVQKLRLDRSVDSIHSINLVRVLDKPAYQIVYFSGYVGEGVDYHVHYALADAVTGAIRPSLSREEAIAVAKENVIGAGEFSGVEYIKQTNGYHEYREKPLPAWAITFNNPPCTVYVSAELGTYQSVRHNQWRAFDLLYMFHTMDYAGRDNFNNWLLKIVSAFGLLTVVSGFTLFIVSSRMKKIPFA